MCATLYALAGVWVFTISYCLYVGHIRRQKEAGLSESFKRAEQKD